jgi:aspartate racemase
VDASLKELSHLASSGSSIGVIATRATISAQIFDPALLRLGYKVVIPNESVMDTLVLPGIEMVKADETLRGAKLIEQSVQWLFNHGAPVVLACTETPLAMDAIKSPLRSQCVDTTAALARSCVAWWQSNQASRIAAP